MNVADLSDSDQVYQLQKRLNSAAERLARLVPEIGKAKQIIEFSSDRRKRALAKAMVGFIEAGESAAAAEAKARASFTYGQDMQGLEKDLRGAETTKAEWEAVRTQWESCRSLLSLEKELSRL